MAQRHFGEKGKSVTGIVKNILGTVIAAGIVANFAVLWQFSDRMARIETTQTSLVKSVESVLQNQGDFRQKIAGK